MSGQKNKISRLLVIILILSFVGSILTLLPYFLDLPKLYLNNQAFVEFTVMWLIFIAISLSIMRQTTQKTVDDKDCQNPEQAKTMVNAIGEGVIVLGNNLNIEIINPEAQKITGWHDDPSGLNFQSILQFENSNGEDLSEDENPITIAINSKKSYETDEINLKTFKQTSVPIQLKINPIGDTGKWVVVFNDISASVRKNQEQMEFISTASHEMRTPVAAIDGYLSLILNPKICQVDAKALDYASKAQESSRHLGELFKNLLNISKMEDGRITAKNEVIDMISFMEKIYENAIPIVTQKNLAFHFLPHRQPREERKIKQVLYVYSDKSLLTEIFANLIENAVKYTNQGEVTIDVFANQKNEIVCAITDTGIGIAETDIPHLFQKFYRVDNRDTREIGGTGLGLYLVKQITKSLGGRIWVESKVGVGSKFYFALQRLEGSKAEQILSVDQVNPHAQNNEILASEIELVLSPNSDIKPERETRIAYARPNQTETGSKNISTEQTFQQENLQKTTQDYQEQTKEPEALDNSVQTPSKNPPANKPENQGAQSQFKQKVT